MQTTIVKIDTTNIDTEQIRQAAEIIDNGGLVAFPTETVYGIGCRVEKESLIKLGKIKGRDPDKHYTLHITDKTEIAKYLPKIGLRSKKLIDNVWPGPLTIVFELDSADLVEIQSRFTSDVLESIYKDTSIGIRCPDHPVAATLLKTAKYPVVAPSANLSGRPPAVDGTQVLDCFGGQIDFLIDAGSCKYKKSSTVVKAGCTGVEILREGVYSAAELEKLSEVSFLFVCTGNTCRSPMAEGLFRKYLAEKLRCKVDQLGKMGYKIYSAGVIETVGLPASPESIKACAGKGVDIQPHKSNTLSRRLIETSDLIFAMGLSHCEHIISLCPEAVNKCMRLAENEDIFDPIGQPQQVYDKCADLIEDAVKKRVGELVL